MRKNKTNNKRGQIKSTLVKIVLFVAFFLIVILIFFGEGLLTQGFDALRNLNKEIPDVEPDKGELDFFRNQDNQLKFLKNFHTAMQTAVSCNAIGGGCLLELPSLEQEGFYDEGYNFYIDQTDADTITLRLTKSSKQDYESKEAAIQSPVATMEIKGAQLCIIKEPAAYIFYTEFNDIKPGETPQPNRVTPTPVDSLLISSWSEEGEKRKIGYKFKQIDDKYTWATFFKKGTKTQPYVFKNNWNGKTYLCFFPTRNDIGITSQCEDPGLGLTETDCFDSDAEGSRSIPYNFKKGLIPAQFKCGDTTVVDSNCLCGGKYNKYGTEYKCGIADWSKDQCDCFATIAKKQDKNAEVWQGVDTKNNNAYIDCRYAASGCAAALKYKPDILTYLKENPGKCPS